MKKVFNLSIILAVLMAAFTFSSCNKNEDPIKPTLTVTQTNDADGNYVFHVDARAGDAKLVTFTIMNGANYAVDMDGKMWDGSNSGNGAGKINTNAFVQDITFTKYANPKQFIFTVTDKDNESDAITKTATDVSTGGGGSTALSAEQPFQLIYIGYDPQPDRTKYGLKYDQNVSTTKARFTATNIVELNEAAYSAITTKELLAAAYTAASKVQKIEVSTTGFTTQYLIVQDNSTLRLVKMTALSIAQGNSVASFEERY